MYCVDKASGHASAYTEEGSNTPLLVQVSDEFCNMFPIPNQLM